MSGSQFYYRGARLFVPPTADITENFFRRHARLLQEAIREFELDEDEAGVAPWAKGEDPIFTLEISRGDGLNTNVVPVEPHERVMWAVYSRHTAMHPGLSPFVRRREWPSATALTIEFAGTGEQPILTRAYPGEYQPPLPWMKSASSAPGGVAEAAKYWSGHALIRTTTTMKGVPTRDAPDWYARPALSA